MFFGREGDIQRLYELVVTNQQVLLYAKSGLGKSSLINAGLVPKLVSPNCNIVPIRFTAYLSEEKSISPLQSTHYALSEAMPSFLDRIVAQEGSLWYHFKSDAINAATPQQYVLLFDQFEEIFSYPEAQIFAFKKQLADLLYRVVPKQLRAILEVRQAENPALLTDEELRQLHQPMDIKALYAIREDRYSELNRIADFLPDMLQHRFQLLPLNRTQAEDAIVEPANLVGNYITERFGYAPEALKKILDYLASGDGNWVETTQLQVLCSHLEKLGKALVTLQEVDFKFDNIFVKFYEDCIRSLQEEDRLIVRRFIEEEMIKDGQRIPCHEKFCKSEEVPMRALELLLKERHLLRTERSTTGGLSYELAHDTLIGPILLAKESRIASEKAQQLEAARAKTEAEQAEKERLRAAEARHLREELELEQVARLRGKRQLRRTRVALLGAILAAALAVTALVYALDQKKEVERLDEENQKITSGDYYYADRFGLKSTLRLRKDGAGRVSSFYEFGYVNKKGESIIPYQFEEASPFDLNTGFARVRKDGIYYLIDTTAKPLYRMAMEIDQLSDCSFKALDLTGDQAAAIPLGLPGSSCVEILLMNGLSLDSFPKEIEKWDRLQYIGLNDNRLDSLPSGIGNLTALKKLSVDRNQLTSITREIKNLKSLEVLSLRVNRLDSLPSEIGELAALRKLRLRANHLTALPTEIGNLKALTSIDLSENKLKSLPPSFGNLKALTSIYLWKNKLSELPPAFKYLKNLKSLTIGENPCTDTDEKKAAILKQMHVWLPNCEVTVR